MIRSDNKIMFGAKVPFQDVFTPAVVNNNNDFISKWKKNNKVNNEKILKNK